MGRTLKKTDIFKHSEKGTNIDQFVKETQEDRDKVVLMPEQVVRQIDNDLITLVLYSN